MSFTTTAPLLNGLVFVLSTLVTGSQNVRILGVTVPSIVKNGSDPVVLDCDYRVESVDPESDGLIVKWYFKNSPTPVFQWIAGMQPQESGVLRRRLNLNYTASTESDKLYKAIQIVTPTIELSGEYKCLVTTFESEATSEEKKMIVYVPERAMLLYSPRENRKEGSVRVVCTAEGVYPEPNMTISTREKLGQEDNVKIDIEVSLKDDLYDVTAKMEFDERGDKGAITFDCILRIPDANYTVHKSIIYYPAGKKTTTTAPESKSTSTSRKPLRSYRTTPRIVANRTYRTHYLDPELFREGDTNSGCWPVVTWLLLLLPLILTTRL